MSSSWPVAVREAVRRVAFRHGSDRIERQILIDEELDRIVAETQTRGATPAQTLSRVLQDLRDEGDLEFVESGRYRLTKPLVADGPADLSPSAIDAAIRERRLVVAEIATGVAESTGTRRIGQDRVRVLTLQNYRGLCAVCDVSDASLLVASHIVPWSAAPEGRGDLTNVICLCAFHDRLFEKGYWSLTDELSIIARTAVPSATISSLLPPRGAFRMAEFAQPASTYLYQHRCAHGFASAGV